jgi:small nuclear ribonucleoprotein (snRNP)-like protein
MKIENLRPYLNEVIELSLKNGQYYKGRLITISDDAIVIDTIKSKLTIDVVSISLIKQKGARP